MIHITTSTRFRLSAVQMSIIWPGLDLIFKSYRTRVAKGKTPYAYPFQMYPPSGGFKRGTFSQFMMDKFVALCEQPRSKAKSGGRVEMDTIELRATIFAIRAYIDFVRGGRHLHRRSVSKLKALLLLDDQSFDKLKTKSKRVIHTLERHLKRANRALQKSDPPEAFALLMHDWKDHLIWMRLHIAYFKPPPLVVKGRKIQQQRILDELMKMAEHGIRNEDHQPPEAKELRRMMRLYVRSARRGREGDYDVPYTLRHKNYFKANRHVGMFVLDRLKVKELPKP